MPDDASGGQPLHGTQGGGSTPVPDPTILTTEQVNRLERTMRVLIVAEVQHLTELVKAESHGDRELVQEEFRGVESRFVALEGRTAEQKKDCVAASTPILCADLIWRPAGSLCVGDELIACDDETPSSGSRMFRRSTVVYNDLRTDDLLVVGTTNGSLSCNRRHPLLVKRPSGQWEWTRAADLRIGDVLCRPVEADEGWEERSIAGEDNPVVTAVDDAGEGVIAHLSTSTGTYIAGGFASHNTKDALDAALAAQKEAVAAQTESSEKSINKSEAATGERIKAVEALLSSSSSALDGKLTSMTVTFDQRLVDVKERVARLEDRKVGADETKAQHVQGTDNTTKIVAMIAGILVVLIAAASLIYAVTRHPTTNGVSPAPVACAIAAAGETCVK